METTEKIVSNTQVGGDSDEVNALGGQFYEQYSKLFS